MSEPMETDRQRRERETIQEREFFKAWWEAYKIALTITLTKVTRVSMKTYDDPVVAAAVGVEEPIMPIWANTANTVEQDYRKRHALMFEAIESIWNGYENTEDWKPRTRAL